MSNIYKYLKTTYKQYPLKKFNKTNNEYLRGLKIRLAGCFGRNRLAKQHILSRGKMPLNTISENIDFCKNVAYSKNGACGIKIWLNYNR